MGKKYVVEKRNILNDIRSNDMNFLQTRLFGMYLSKINPRDMSTRYVKFKLEEYRKLAGISKINIEHYKEVTKKLLQHVISLPDGRGGYDQFQLFRRCKVYKDENDEWVCEIDAHDESLPLMFDFKREYFVYDYEIELKLDSENKVKLYSFLKQYEKIGKVIIEIPALKSKLGILQNEYSEWFNFKRRVLEPCCKSINDYTDISVSYNYIKKGRSIVGLEFIINNKKHISNAQNLKIEEVHKFIRGLFGIGERAFTLKEEEMIRCWIIDWGYDSEIIRLAYDKCINAINKVSFDYINAIMKRWNCEKVTSIEEIQKLDEKFEYSSCSFDPDEFLESALKRGFDDLK